MSNPDISPAAVEEWRDIPGTDGAYRASSLGRIYSVKRSRVLTPRKTPSGYYRISIMVSGSRKTYPVSRLICLTFHGESTGSRKWVAHIDGTRDNNVPSNLAWVTASENEEHKRLHGTAVCGRRSPYAKLSDEVAAEIRRLRSEEGMPFKQIASIMNVHQSTVKHVVSGIGWNHVGDGLGMVSEISKLRAELTATQSELSSYKVSDFVNQDNIAILEAKLATARNDALADAARIADSYRFFPSPTNETAIARETIARHIRALMTSPAQKDKGDE